VRIAHYRLTYGRSRGCPSWSAVEGQLRAASSPSTEATHGRQAPPCFLWSRPAVRPPVLGPPWAQDRGGPRHREHAGGSFRQRLGADKGLGIADRHAGGRPPAPGPAVVSRAWHRRVAAEAFARMRGSMPQVLRLGQPHRSRSSRQAPTYRSPQGAVRPTQPAQGSAAAIVTMMNNHAAAGSRKGRGASAVSREALAQRHSCCGEQSPDLPLEAQPTVRSPGRSGALTAWNAHRRQSVPVKRGREREPRHRA
jgi:hypothetical protein